VRSATADERGQFEFVSLPPGRYGLSVENSYFGSAVQPTEVDAASGGAQWKELRLTRVNAVFGTLSDLMVNEVQGSFTEPMDPVAKMEREEQLLRRLRRLNHKPPSGESTPFSAF
jgi:hypothetical protein